LAPIRKERKEEEAEEEAEAAEETGNRVFDLLQYTINDKNVDSQRRRERDRPQHSELLYYIQDSILIALKVDHLQAGLALNPDVHHSVGVILKVKKHCATRNERILVNWPNVTSRKRLYGHRGIRRRRSAPGSEAGFWSHFPASQSTA